MFLNKRKNTTPTIFHVTHQKAGSQWLKAVFKSIDNKRTVESKIHEKQFFENPILAGGIYPALYCSKQRFESVKIPKNSIVFVVIRDLRDTLISLYFSMRYSHAVIDEFIQTTRDKLSALDVPSGLELLIDQNYIEPLAQIQTSWLKSKKLIMKYEEMIADEIKSFNIIFDYCKFNYPEELLMNAVKKSSFEKRSRGRKIGEEDVMSHLRKGIPGDWKNYFTEKLKTTFKKKYGEVLIQTGYEQNPDW